MTLKRMSKILIGRDRLMLVVRFESNKYVNVGKQRVPWTEESGGLQSRGSHRVRHD